MLDDPWTVLGSVAGLNGRTILTAFLLVWDALPGWQKSPLLGAAPVLQLLPPFLLVERDLGSSRCFPQGRLRPAFLGVFSWEIEQDLWSTKPLLGLVRNESVLCCIAGKRHMVRQGPVFLRPPSWDWSRFCEIWVPWLIKERPAVWFGHGGSMSVNECLCAQESEVSRKHHWSPHVTC